MRRTLAILIAFLALAAPASGATLLTPEGQPVGAPWQQWMNSSLMPTYSGQVVLDLGMTFDCNQPSGTTVYACTADAPYAQVAPSVATDPETGIDLPNVRRDFARASDLSDTRRFLLLYEQGHVIDFEYLTDAERAELVSLWRASVAPVGMSLDAYWWQGETVELSAPLVEWFSEDYALCATVRRFNAFTVAAVGDDEMTARYPLLRWRRARWTWAMQAESCGLIRYWIQQAQASE